MAPLDRWISAEIRQQIENSYYAKINEQAAFEVLCRDPDFLAALDTHVALFSDHGIVHVRDVAQQVVTVLQLCNGVLIPKRTAAQLDWLCGYGVLLAYLHDIGMVDFSAFGRSMHPEYAAQAVFNPALDPIIDQFWQENSGGLAQRLHELTTQKLLNYDPQIVLRELLALSMAHSKRKVPVAILNNPAQLRRTVQRAVTTDLYTLYADHPATQTALNDETSHKTSNHRFYEGSADASFAWLIASDPLLRQLTQDVIDTLRALRAADALRQRGTVLKTSGNYEIFVDRRSGNAVFALRHGSDKLFLLETSDPISRGEANVESSALDGNGNLRVTFHRGAFAEDGAGSEAAKSTALIVADIIGDALDSFIGAEGEAAAFGLRAAETTRIQLEETEDNPEFVEHVRDELLKRNPQLTSRIDLIPSFKACSNHEYQRYLSGSTVTWSQQQRRQLMTQMATAGHRVTDINVEQAFEYVRLISLAVGDVLIDAGAASSLVYIPLGEGLVIHPLGGYQSFAVEPWMPLGITGVIRGATRNAAVTADRVLQLLAIPKRTYLHHWHRTHDPASFRTAVDSLLA